MFVKLELSSPLGALTLIADDRALVGLYFPGRCPATWVYHPEVEAHPILDRAARELGEYFRAERRGFSIPLAFPKGTEFQRAVWTALRGIPFGATRSYGELANQIEKPRAVRAVGAANGRNPISIIVPCHRVIGADGSLTGFGGGMPAKRFLLDLESEAVADLVDVGATGGVLGEARGQV